MPGSLTSSVYSPCPVMSRGSSRRLMEAPNRRVTAIDSLSFQALALFAAGSSANRLGSTRRSHLLGGRANRGHNILVAGAATEISFELLANLRVGRMGVALQ